MEGIRLILIKCCVILLSLNCAFVTCLVDTYDFIIVGGGTAGLTVARRLAESPTTNFTVLVLETGGWPKHGSEVPALAPQFLGDSDVTYRYKSVRQWNAGLLVGGHISIISGKMLGGTSSLNYMWFNRGNPKDYDNWANVTGDHTWSYNSMLQHFRNVESYHGQFPSAQHHGTSGPITITQPHYAPGLNLWLTAGHSLGYPVSDPSGPQRVSFTPVEFSKKFGRRVSSLTGYITPSINSLPNLHILTKTNGTRIIFEGNRAIGVQIKSNLHNNLQNHIVYARHEVIVSSGAHGSPLLLQRSGIGPKALLKSAKIPLIADLPVGLNLQNHVAIPLNFIINNTKLIFDETTDLNPQTWQEYQLTGDGPYSSGRGATGQAFIASTIAKSEGQSDWPDLQLVMSHSRLPYIGFSEAYLSNVTIDEGDVPMSGAVFLMRPKSRGRIEINREDPYEGQPMIDLGYLIDRRDMKAVIDGIKVLLSVFEETEGYRRIGAEFRRIHVEECDRLRYRSDEYWECYVRWSSEGACHPAGSAAMGGVVDNKLRVFGVEGLRVVDASVMPFVTNGNTQAAVYGVAEKGVGMILGEHHRDNYRGWWGSSGRF